MPQDISFDIAFDEVAGQDPGPARSRNLRWVRQMGLVKSSKELQQFTSWRLEDLASYAYPLARGENLALALDTLSLFFLFDDQFDTEIGKSPEMTRSLAARLVRVAETEAPEHNGDMENPIICAFADIWQRSCIGMPYHWISRARENWIDYFYSHVEEAINKRDGIQLHDKAYMQLRRRTVGIFPSVDLGERVQGFCITPEQYQSADVAALISQTADIIALTNDIFSVEKEQALLDPHNAVIIYETSNSVSRKNAVQKVRARINQELREFTSLRRRLLTTGECTHEAGTDNCHLDDCSLKQFVQCLGHWIHANYKWGNVSERYA